MKLMFIWYCCVQQSSSLVSKLEEFCEQHGVNLSSLKTVIKSLLTVLKSKVFSCLYSVSEKLFSHTRIVPTWNSLLDSLKSRLDKFWSMHRFVYDYRASPFSVRNTISVWNLVPEIIAQLGKETIGLLPKTSPHLTLLCFSGQSLCNWSKKLCILSISVFYAVQVRSDLHLPPM